MRDYRKIIQEDVDWLFTNFELENCKIIKSVKPDRLWDYTLNLKMGKPIGDFHGVRENEDGTVDCVPPWSLEELLQFMIHSSYQKTKEMK